MKYIISLTISLIVLFNCYGQTERYRILGNRHQVDTGSITTYYNFYYTNSETDSNNVTVFNWTIADGDTTLYVGDSLATIKYLLNQSIDLYKRIQGNAYPKCFDTVNTQDKEMWYDGYNIETTDHKMYNNNSIIADTRKAEQFETQPVENIEHTMHSLEKNGLIGKTEYGIQSSLQNTTTAPPYIGVQSGSIGNNSFTLADNYTKTDTIPCIMLLCDTSVHVGYSGYFSGDGVAENMAPHNFYNSYMYWLFGYRISSGLGKCLKYIDNEYKPLPFNHMVWISIKTEKK